MTTFLKIILTITAILTVAGFIYYKSQPPTNHFTVTGQRSALVD